MSDILVELASNFQGEYLKLAVALILSGFVILALNSSSHALIEAQKDRRSRQGVVERSLHPVLTAAGALISRIADILVTHQESMRRIISEYKAGSFVERAKDLRPLELNRHESTAFRLINFLTLSLFFQRQTADLPTFDYLERANYFLQHKIAVALRGYLYNVPMLSTEVQEEMAASFLAHVGAGKATDLTVGQFCRLLREGAYEPELFALAMQVFAIDSEPLAKGLELDRNNPNWRHLLVLAQLGIYLIDFFQDFEDNSQWEEERVLFAKVIRQWNADSVRQRYLYEPGDVSTGNYIDTFPGRVTPPALILSLIESGFEKMHLKRPLERMAKSMRLNLRGGRFRRRHDTKKIRRWGVCVKTKKGPQELRWNDDLPSLYRAVEGYLRSRIVG